MNKEDFIGFFEFAAEVANGLAQRDQVIAELKKKLEVSSGSDSTAK